MSANAIVSTPRKITGLDTWNLSFQSDSDRVLVAELRPDGKTLLLLHRGSNDDPSTWRWSGFDLDKFERIPLPFNGAFSSMSANGKKVARIKEKEIEIWENGDTLVKKRTLRSTGGPFGAFGGLAWSSDTKTFTACAMADGHNYRQHVWRLDTVDDPRVIESVPGLNYSRWPLSPDGKKVALGERKEGVHIYDAVTGKMLLTLKGNGGTYGAPTWSPTGKLHASMVDTPGELRIHEVERGEVVYSYKDSSDSEFVAVPVWSGDGKKVAYSSTDKTATVVDVERKKCCTSSVDMRNR